MTVAPPSSPNVVNWLADWLQKKVAATSRHQNIKNCHIEKSQMPVVNAIDDNNNSNNWKEELNTKISLVVSLSVLTVE